MRKLQAFCITCGPVDLEGPKIRVEEAVQLGWAIYHFDCARCGTSYTRDPDRNLLALLAESGAQFETVSAPLEFLEPKPWPPLNVDDLITFGLALGAGNYVADYFTHVDLDAPEGY